MPIKIKLIGAEALEKIGKLAAGSKETLMQDLVGASTRFGFDAVEIAKKEYLTGPRPERLGVGTGRLRSSLSSKVERDGSVIKTSVGTNVIYAAIHEKGGTVKPTVSDRMRKFAWAMFFKTKDDKFKRLALTKKNRLTINIPARPFIQPSIEDAMPSFQENISRVLGALKFVES